MANIGERGINPMIDEDYLDFRSLARSFTTVAWLSLYTLSSLIGFALVLLVSWKLIDDRPPGLFRFSGEILLLLNLAVWSAILVLLVLSVRDLVRAATDQTPVLMTDRFLRDSGNLGSTTTRVLTTASYFIAVTCPLFPLAMLLVDDALYSHHQKSPIGPFQAWNAFVQHILVNAGPRIPESRRQSR